MKSRNLIQYPYNQIFPLHKSTHHISLSLLIAVTKWQSTRVQNGHVSVLRQSWTQVCISTVIHDKKSFVKVDSQGVFCLFTNSSNNTKLSLINYQFKTASLFFILISFQLLQRITIVVIRKERNAEITDRRMKPVNSSRGLSYFLGWESFPNTGPYSEKEWGEDYFPVKMKSHMKLWLEGKPGKANPVSGLVPPQGSVVQA